MKDYDPKMSFADDASAAAHETRGDEEAAVACLASLAGAGPVLELAIGTGRLALPLAANGLTVDGVDFSPAMLARLRAKPGGEALEVVEGDFADVKMDRRYALIFIAWNSFFNLLTQERQVDCFRNVAAHLEPGGAFLIEAFVPSFLYRYESHQHVEVEHLDASRVQLGVSMHDPANQRLEQQHVSLGASGTTLTPVCQRYAWPAELDLMAELAGLNLDERWGGWQKEPFTKDSTQHVTVYRRSA